VNFTRAAWERIFEEYVPYSPGELDYKGFVRLVLALEHPTSPQSIRYFWRILDFDQSGRLTPLKINDF
jgi:Ca2+-binding EF-hand superfamily protein